MIGVFFFAMGIHGDMYARIRENQEKILIRIKRTESILANSERFKRDNNNNREDKKRKLSGYNSLKNLPP
jgi:hypothetical protein